MTQSTRRNLLGIIFPALLLAAGPLSAQVRVLQTNSQGGSVHLIDPETSRVVGEIEGIPVNHGIQASPDGRRIYVSSEGDQTLDVVDTSTMRVIKSIPLSARPNNIAITPDGSRVYVGIIVPPGAIDVIDTARLENIKSIPHPGGIHNIYVTPDGKYVVAGSIAGSRLTVIDTATDQEVWAWEGHPIRPVAMNTKPDGSTDKLFVQISEHHGFVVVDFDTHKEVARITLPDVPPEDREPGTYNGAPSHGIGVSPDGRTIWATSRMNSYVYVYSLPELELLASVPVGTDPDWVTFTPDSTMAYVANAVSNDVSAIDMKTYEEVARIPVGQSPKRNAVIVLPSE
jgi:YVTN family beta-propeller protein